MFNEYFTSINYTDDPDIYPKDYIYPNKDKDEDYKDALLDTFDTPEFKYMDELPVLIPPLNTNRLPSKKEIPVNNKKDFSSPQAYVNTMYPYLYNALEKYGLDGNLWTPTLLAQTSIESNWGNKFSRENNNFGGIKGTGSGKVSTKEWDPKRGYYTIKDSFKSYNSIEDFANDYVKKLKNKFKAFIGTPEEYVANIRKNGYFTDSLENYQLMVNSRIKRIRKLL